MPLVKVQGIVLKTINIGEYDKILTLFSDKLGKIDAVSHGCKKPNNKLIATSQPFCFGEYILFKGRSMYTVNEASINESFQKILLDYNKIIYASYFAELFDSLSPYEYKNVRLLSLLVKSLFLLCEEEKIDIRLLRFAVDFKAISIAGYMPIIKNCVKCGEPITHGNFSIDDGGMLCENCITKYHVYEINRESLDILYIIKNIKLEQLRDIKYDINILIYMQKIIEEYIENKTEKKFKTIDMIKNL